jgi:hypothetical protein
MGMFVCVHIHFIQKEREREKKERMREKEHFIIAGLFERTRGRKVGEKRMNEITNWCNR